MTPSETDQARINSYAKILVMEKLVDQLRKKKASDQVLTMDGTSSLYLLEKAGRLTMPSQDERLPQDLDVTMWSDVKTAHGHINRNGFDHVAKAAEELGFAIHDVPVSEIQRFPKTAIEALINPDELRARLPEALKNTVAIPATVELEVHALPDHSLYWPPLTLPNDPIGYRSPIDLLAFKMTGGLRKGKEEEPMWRRAKDLFDLHRLAGSSVQQDGKTIPVFDWNDPDKLREMRLSFLLKTSDQPPKFFFDRYLPLTIFKQDDEATLAELDKSLRAQELDISRETQIAMLSEVPKYYEAIFPEAKEQHGDIRQCLTPNEMAFLRNMSYPPETAQKDIKTYIRRNVEQYLMPEYADVFDRNPGLLTSIVHNSLLQQKLEEEIQKLAAPTSAMVK